MNSKEVIYNEKGLNELCKEYQKILRLEDWDIRVELKPLHELGEGTDGKCFTDLPLLSALIQIPTADSWKGSNILRHQNMARTLIHELIHVVLSGLSPPKKDEMADQLYESGIERLSQAIYTLHKENELLSLRDAD